MVGQGPSTNCHRSTKIDKITNVEGNLVPETWDMVTRTRQVVPEHDALQDTGEGRDSDSGRDEDSVLSPEEIARRSSIRSIDEDLVVFKCCKNAKWCIISYKTFFN